MAATVYRAKPFLLAAVAASLGFLVPDASGAGVSYTYDLSGRVAAALYDNGMCVAYTYDSAGNRTAQANATAPSPPAWGSGVWGCFSWTP